MPAVAISVGLAAAVLGLLHLANGFTIALWLLVSAAIGGGTWIWEHNYPKSTANRVSWRARISVVVVLTLVIVGLAYSLDNRSVGNARPLAGGCPPGDEMVVYAQNRWQPPGAQVREAPYANAPEVRGLAPNKQLVVDGWVETHSAHPQNSAPWNSKVWFHLLDGTGWVSFGAVRAVASEQDPTLHDSYGGEPVPILDTCRGALG